jgi:3-methylcrotonyl-CoA carboxylase alpha subunit
MVLSGLDRAPGALDGFALWQPLGQDVSLRVDGTGHVVRLSVIAPGEVDLSVGDDIVQARHGANGWRYDGQTAWACHSDGMSVTLFGAEPRRVCLVDPLERDAFARANTDVIEAPMPGFVRSVHVADGDRVSKGDRLVVLEAMKMEHSLLAARDGVIAEVMTTPGTQVEAGAVLIQLEEETAT